MITGKTMNARKNLDRFAGEELSSHPANGLRDDVSGPGGRATNH